MELSRRDLLRAGAGAAAASSAFPLTAVAARARRDPFARAGGFSSGVASGLPSTDGAVLWTRLDELTGPRARLRLEIARDPDFRQVVRRTQVRATALRDQTARTQVDGLPAGEQFFYRFATRTTSSRVGRFRTLRPADSREPVRIGFFSCARYEHGYFTPQAGLAAEDLDLVVSLGDYMYEEDSRPKLPGRDDGAGKPNGHVETLDQFRRRYRAYRSDSGLQAMHAQHAVFGIWDDCEVEGNWAGEQESSGGNPSGERSIPFAVKRRNAFNAYFEWMPFARTRAERYKVFRAVPLGANAELLLLDTRQFRDPQPCGDRDVTGGPCIGEDDLPRKRLGDEQKAWLKRRLVDSPATWKVLGNAQMMMALDLVPGQPVAHDSWDGYAAERREVLEHAHARGVKNLTSIVGDVHVFFAGDLHTSGRVGSPRVGTEFVGASVTHDALTLPGLPQEQSDLVVEQLPVVNPHLKYAELSSRGYATMELARERTTVRFLGVDTVLEPTAKVTELARFEVLDGVPEARRV